MEGSISSSPEDGIVMIYFGSPESFIGLILIPMLIVFYVWVFKRKKKLLIRFGKIESVRKLISQVSYGAQYIKAILLIIIALLLVFVLARPQYGAIQRPIIQRGVDIMIAIDVSNSMLARDITPNRLARAKEQLRNLIHRVKGDRIGIIAFAGDAFIACPLTLDKGLAADILDSIDTKTVPIQGTAIGDAIRMAMRAYERSGQGHKVLILLTDGEDHEGAPLEAAKEAAKSGIIIYAIGIGSERGELIPLEGGKYKEDRSGHKVTSKLDFTILQKIALSTGGKAVKANPTGDLELDIIYSDISTLDKKLQQSRTYTLYEDRFQWILLPTLLLLILESLKSDRARVRRAFKESYK